MNEHKKLNWKKITHVTYFVLFFIDFLFCYSIWIFFFFLLFEIIFGWCCCTRVKVFTGTKYFVSAALLSEKFVPVNQCMCIFMYVYTVWDVCERVIRVRAYTGKVEGKFSFDYSLYPKIYSHTHQKVFHFRIFH